MENDKTIKELADELEISKQALQKRINNLPDNLKPTKVGGKFLISPILQRYFYDILKIRQPSDNKVVEVGGDLEMVVSDLKKDKLDLIHRLEVKEKEMERMQKLLDQQQQLTLQANKQIEQLQSQLVFLLTDNDEQAMMKEESFDDKKENESVKKWYHFWK